MQRSQTVLLNEMRFLLERHYDEIHAARYYRNRGKDDDNAAEGKQTRHRSTSNMRLVAKIEKNYVHERHETLKLPHTIQDILRSPEDEGSDTCTHERHTH